MTSFAARVRADARLAILQILSKDRHYSMNHEVLNLAVDRLTAISLSEPEMKVQLGWLEDKGLIETDEASSYVLAKLTDEGLKVANGSIDVEGISRPRPSDL